MAYKDLYLSATVDDNDIWLADFTSTANTQYYGYARPGTSQSAESWKIYVIDLDADGVPIGKRFAGGSPAYVAAWSERVNYVYS